MELSFEFFPPKTTEGLDKLKKTANEFKALNPDYFSVTFGAGGSTRDQTPDTVFSIAKETSTSTVPHISCMGSSKEQLKDLMTQYKENGIKHLLVLRGDKPSGSGTDGDFKHASDLVKFTRDEFGDAFHITVSAYPEPHPESKNLETELEYFKLKVGEGADAAITQYFYNADAYSYFVERVRGMGIDIPIIPGVMPILNYEKLKRFSGFCGAEIPLWICKQLEAYDNPEDVKKFGFEVTHRLSQRLLDEGAPGIHFYTLNMLEPSLELAKQLS